MAKEYFDAQPSLKLSNYLNDTGKEELLIFPVLDFSDDFKVNVLLQKKSIFPVKKLTYKDPS